MAITNTLTISFTGVSEQNNPSVVLSSEDNREAGFIVSGHTVAFDGDSLPSLQRLASFYGRFQGPAQVRLHMSGSYLSGGVGGIMDFNSGRCQAWLVGGGASDRPPMNFLSGATAPCMSGTVTAISARALDGTTVPYSGTLRMGFSGTITSG